MNDKLFRHHLARLLQDAATKEAAVEHAEKAEKEVRRLKEHLEWVGPVRVETDGARSDLNLLLRIEPSSIGYRTDPKRYVDDALEYARRELYKALKIVE